MLDWIRGVLSRKSPRVFQNVIGEVRITSGCLLLMDPMGACEPVRMTDIPEGRYPVHANIIRYPEGALRIARIGMKFRPGGREIRKVLGTIDVDSATVIAIDAQAYDSHWKFEGTERIGLASGPETHLRVAKLIEKQFGLHSKEIDFLHSRFDEPIDEDLEQQITEYLQTFPEFAEHTSLYFRIKTMSSFEIVSEALRDSIFTEVLLDTQSDARVLAFESGFGDGTYAVEGFYDHHQLIGIEVEFIGPTQDKVLEAFPCLRYG